MNVKQAVPIWMCILILCLLRSVMFAAIIIVTFIVSDENRDINGHPDDDLKRQRSQYNGDQLYSNVSTSDRQQILSLLRNTKTKRTRTMIYSRTAKLLPFCTLFAILLLCVMLTYCFHNYQSILFHTFY